MICLGTGTYNNLLVWHIPTTIPEDSRVIIIIPKLRFDWWVGWVDYYSQHTSSSYRVRCWGPREKYAVSTTNNNEKVKKL